MNIVFFGLGSIGRRHVQLLAQRPGVNIYALRSHQGQTKAGLDGVKDVDGWKALEGIQLDAAFITNPTALHISTALACAKKGIPIFLEKPVGASVQGLDELLAVVQEKKCVTYVAYVLRFAPVILRLKEIIEQGQLLRLTAEASSYLPAWRPGTDYRNSYSASKQMGGGVILDLSHEIDYVHFLTGGIESMNGEAARRSGITLDSEDYARIDATTAKGPAEITLSYFSHVPKRALTLFMQDKTVEADLIKGTIAHYKGHECVSAEMHAIDPNDLYRRQLDYFLNNLNNTQMMNNLPEASVLFKKICQFKEKVYA